MNTEIGSKINKLMQIQPSGVVLTSSWLKSKGYSAELLRTYRNSNWLQSIGNGAMIRKNDSVDYNGAIYAMQQQMNLSVHPAAKTALSLMGKSHFLELGNKKVFIFGQACERLPSWFKKYNWGVDIRYNTTAILPADKGLIEKTYGNFIIKISSPARAMIECLYLAPQKQDLLECFEMMESLNNLNPSGVQELLEYCSSVKVKRLFLYMAEKAEHDWFKHINTSRIDLGAGKRSLANDGIYLAAYNMTVPRELESYGNTRL
jgi:hypothetical protein